MRSKTFLVVVSTLALFIAACASVGPQDPASLPDLSGVWTGSWQSDGGVGGALSMEFDQDDTGALTGRVEVGGTACLTEGTVTGTVRPRGISFGAVQGENDVNFTATLKGDDLLNGTYHVSIGDCSGDEGTFQMSRAKEPI